MKKFVLMFYIALISSHTIAAEWDSPEALISSMSVEKKVGQLFIFGFTGKSVNQSLRKKLETLYPGSIIVFSRNIRSLNQLRSLNEGAQRIALENTHLPLFIAVDQEGGKVLRIKTSPSLPSARTLALTEDPALVRSAGYVTGQLLSVLGFNMNLAPVVDISNPNDNDFLGNRSFGDRKEIVKEMSVAFARGLIDSNVLPTAKHFPGHGGVRTDSHLSMPTKQVTLQDLINNDLYPYQALIDQSVPFAIMASHISYPLIDKSGMPASFSNVLLKNVLRKKLKFPGITLTDDIQMKGANLRGLGVGERAVRAILAGNDIVMVGWNYNTQKKAVRAVIKAVRTGRISEDRINESLRRIFSAKLKFFKQNIRTPSLKHQLKRIAFSDIYNSIFDRVFTNQKPSHSKTDQALKVFSFSYRFLSSFRKIHEGNAHYNNLKHFKRWGKKQVNRTIVYHLSGPLSAKILRSAPEQVKKNTIVINSSSKIDLKNQSLYKKVINVFSYHPNLGSFTAKHLKTPPVDIRRPASPSFD